MTCRHPGLLLAAALLWGPAPVGADLADLADPAELTLEVAGSTVAVTEDARAHWMTRLSAYFEACLPYSAVVVHGDRPSPEELERRWTEAEDRDHALLRVTGAPDSRHAELHGRHFELLVGLDPGRGGVPVLTRGADGTLALYIKCPGLEGLLLGCLAEETLIGGASRPPSSDCARWREIQRRVEPGSMTSPEKEN